MGYSYCIFIVFSLLLCPSVTPFVYDDNLHGLEARYSCQSDQPIVINGNDDFLTGGWPGNGTEEAPYIISGLEITQTSMPCVSISNTSAYFVITDCVLRGPNVSIFVGGEIDPSQFSGCVELTNVKRGVMTRCTLSGFGSAVLIEGCLGTDLSLCTFTDCYYGIRIRDSDDIIVTNCTFGRAEGPPDRNYHGILVEDSSNCSLKNNVVTGGFLVHNYDYLSLLHAGMTIIDSEECAVIQNRFVSSGIRIVGLPSVSLDNNTVNGLPIVLLDSLVECEVDASEYGQLLLTDCENVTVSGGRFNKTACGVAFLSCALCSIRATTVGGSTGGFLLDGCSDCRIANSTVKDSAIACFMWSSTNCSVENTSFINNVVGVEATGSPRTKIGCCAMSDISRTGVWLFGCHDSQVKCNSIAQSSLVGVGSQTADSYAGAGRYVSKALIPEAYSSLYLSQSNRSLIAGNSLSGFFLGLALQSSGCAVVNNTISHCSWGIAVSGSGNRIYSNALRENGHNAVDNAPGNLWDDGVSVGNNWDDYTGIGFYLIGGSAGAVDRFPNGTDWALTLSFVGFALMASLACTIILVRLKIRRRR
jgi:parallel beta-helix repeat protein